MTPLPHPISTPEPRGSGPVGLRAIRGGDAKALSKLLTENRAWLEPWEATFPNGHTAVPGQGPMGPVIRAMNRQRRLGSGVTFLITYESTPVGQLSISDISAGAVRSASLGYWISKEMAGKGITPVAVALAIDYAFQELRLHRIEICIRPENTASLRIVQKLGMRYEGRRERYIHIGGRWCDHDCFGVTAEEVPLGMLARIGAPTA